MHIRSLSLVSIISLVLLMSLYPLVQAREENIKKDTDGAELIEYIVARVNNKVITYSELQDAVDDLKQSRGSSITNESELKAEALDALIIEKLIISIAEVMNLSPSQEEVNQLIEEFKKENKIETDEQLNAELKKQGKSITWLRNQFERILLLRKVIYGKVYAGINVGEDEITDYYNRHIREYSTEDQVRIRQIFISVADKEDEDARKRIIEAYQKLQGGMSFEEAVQIYGDPAARSNNGDLGYFKQGEIIAALDEAAFKLNPGEYSNVIKTDNGYHIIQVTEKKISKNVPLSELKETIIEKIRMQKFEEESKKYINKLKEDNYISILDPELKQLMIDQKKIKG